MHIATLACHRAHRKSHAPRSRFLRRQPRGASVTPSHAACSQRHDRAQEHAQTRRKSRTRSCEVQRGAAGERRARTADSRRRGSSPLRRPTGRPGQRPSLKVRQARRTCFSHIALMSVDSAMMEAFTSQRDEQFQIARCRARADLLFWKGRSKYHQSHPETSIDPTIVTCSSRAVAQ